MESIPSYLSQSACPHTTTNSLDSLDSSDNQNTEKKKSSSGKNGRRVKDYSKKKNKQNEVKRLKSNNKDNHREAVIRSEMRETRENLKSTDRNFECNKDSISCIEFPSDLYRTMSKATLIDQESGEVYQLTENERGTNHKTFPLKPNPPISSSTPVHDFHGTAIKTRNFSGIAGKGRADNSEFSNDLQLLIADQDSGSTSSVERFIAVSVSPTYITDHIRSIQAANSIQTKSPACTSRVSALVHAPCELPPPTSERLSPIGANSRATSKLSLYILDDETEC